MKCCSIRRSRTIARYLSLELKRRKSQPNEVRQDRISDGNEQSGYVTSSPGKLVTHNSSNSHEVVPDRKDRIITPVIDALDIAEGAISRPRKFVLVFFRCFELLLKYYIWH